MIRTATEGFADFVPPEPGAGHQIAEAIRALILNGQMVVDERLPSEHELAARFGVSRPTVREALKRLAAQNLIRTRRGATGGNFINRMSWSEAHDQLVTTATMLMTMAPVSAETVGEARLTLLTACVPLAAERHQATHLQAMRAEVQIQRDPATTDEAFCASDVRYYRALVDAAGNPLLAFQMAGVIEAVQPLLNMITFKSRDRAEIATRHEHLCAALERRDGDSVIATLREVSDYTARLVGKAQELRSAGRGKR
ncbi:MAG TPA: GntR family transcriptional regulator [Thermohalobaculum sp.]|nr:GntR family transcriptional regulator [Thermohalobaculum sp.]